MEEPQQSSIPFGKYAAALFICLACLILGNILGLVLSSLQGWYNLDYEKPAGLALSALQTGIGSYLGLAVGNHFQNEARFVGFWLGVLIWINSGLLAALGILAVLADKLDEFISWNMGSYLVGIVVMELVRRYAKDEF